MINPEFVDAYSRLSLEQQLQWISVCGLPHFDTLSIIAMLPAHNRASIVAAISTPRLNEMVATCQPEQQIVLQQALGIAQNIPQTSLSHASESSTSPAAAASAAAASLLDQNRNENAALNHTGLLPTASQSSLNPQVDLAGDHHRFAASEATMGLHPMNLNMPHLGAIPFPDPGLFYNQSSSPEFLQPLVNYQLPGSLPPAVPSRESIAATMVITNIATLAATIPESISEKPLPPSVGEFVSQRAPFFDISGSASAAQRRFWSSLHEIPEEGFRLQSILLSEKQLLPMMYAFGDAERPLLTTAWAILAHLQDFIPTLFCHLDTFQPLEALCLAYPLQARLFLRFATLNRVTQDGSEEPPPLDEETPDGVFDRLVSSYSRFPFSEDREIPVATDEVSLLHRHVDVSAPVALSHNSLEHSLAADYFTYEYHVPELGRAFGPRARLRFLDAVTRPFSFQQYQHFCRCREATFSRRRLTTFLGQYINVLFAYKPPVIPARLLNSLAEIPGGSVYDAKSGEKVISPESLVTAIEILQRRKKRTPKTHLKLTALTIRFVGFLLWDRVGLLVELMRLRRGLSDTGDAFQPHELAPCLDLLNTSLAPIAKARSWLHDLRARLKREHALKLKRLRSQRGRERAKSRLAAPVLQQPHAQLSAMDSMFSPSASNPDVSEPFAASSPLSLELTLPSSASIAPRNQFELQMQQQSQLQKQLLEYQQQNVALRPAQTQQLSQTQIQQSLAVSMLIQQRLTQIDQEKKKSKSSNSNKNEKKKRKAPSSDDGNSTEANTSDEDEDGFGAGPATALHPTQFLAVVLGPSSFTFEQQFQVVREIQALVLIATGKKPKLGRDLKAQICGSSNPPAVPDSSQTAEAIREIELLDVDVDVDHDILPSYAVDGVPAPLAYAAALHRATRPVVPRRPPTREEMAQAFAYQPYATVPSPSPQAVSPWGAYPPPLPGYQSMGPYGGVPNFSPLPLGPMGPMGPMSPMGPMGPMSPMSGIPMMNGASISSSGVLPPLPVPGDANQLSFPLGDFSNENDWLSSYYMQYGGPPGYFPGVYEMGLGGSSLGYGGLPLMEFHKDASDHKQPSRDVTE